MATEKKRVTLHPLKSDGTLNTKVNLYPKTFLDAIVNREGEPVDVATVDQLENIAEDFDDRIQEVEVEIHNKQDTLIAGANITIDADNVISATGGGGAEIYNLDLVENMSTTDLNKLGSFLSTSTKENKEESFSFNDNINLEDLKQYQIIKASGAININKNYKIIKNTPPTDTKGNPIINEGDIFWDYQVSWNGFPSTAISNFLFSNIEVPVPSMISSDFTWQYGANKARFDGIQDTENDQHIGFSCISNPGSSKDNRLDLALYSQELEDAGWVVSDGSAAFIELVGEDIPFDIKLAEKESVKMFFTCYDEGGEEANYHNMIVILDEKPDCFHILDNCDFYEHNFPLNRLTSTLAVRDFPLPPHIDSSIIVPKEKDGWDTEIETNNFTIEESQATYFPEIEVSEFIHPFNSSISIPIPQTSAEIGDEIVWKWQSSVRDINGESPELDAEFKKPYDYLYVWNNQNYYTADSYAELLRQDGWTVIQQPVWAGYTYPEGGYKATKNEVIICFGYDGEYFEMAIYKPTVCTFIAMTVFEKGEQAYDLCPNYFTELENAGFKLVHNDDFPDGFERSYEKDGVQVYLYCGKEYQEDPNPTIANFEFDVIDTRSKNIEVDLNLYFKQQKEENNLPVFKYIDITNNNVVSLTINKSNILGNTIVIGSGSAGNSYELNLNDYFEEDILNEFKEFINGNNLTPSISFPFINSIDLTKLNTYDKVLLTYLASSGGIEGPTLNPSCPTSNTDDPFPINNLENYIGANFHLPYPVEQASGYTNTEWYSGGEGAGGKGDALVYFEPNWSETYYTISDFITRLTNDGWALRQEEPHFGNVESWTAFKKEDSSDDVGVCILINRGDGNSDINDKIYSLHYFWTNELTIGEGKSTNNNVILYKQETKSSKGKFEYISIINNTPIKLTLLNRELLGETGGGGSGSNIPIFRVEAAPEDPQIIEVNSFNDFEENYCFTLDDQLCCLVLHESSGFILTTVTINREIGEEDSSTSISLYNAEESYILLEYGEDYKPEAHWFAVNLEHFSAGGGGGSASTSLAPAWVQGNEYIIGDLVTYKGKLYECLEDNSYWQWESSAWKETSIAESILGLLNEEL